MHESTNTPTPPTHTPWDKVGDSGGTVDPYGAQHLIEQLKYWPPRGGGIWFSYLQLIRPQSLGSVFVVSLCVFKCVAYC